MKTNYLMLTFTLSACVGPAEKTTISGQDAAAGDLQASKEDLDLGLPVDLGEADQGFALVPDVGQALDSGVAPDVSSEPDAAMADSSSPMDIGSADTGSPGTGISSVQWTVPRALWSGPVTSLSFSLLSADGSLVDVDPEQLQVLISSGTSTAEIGSVQPPTSGNYQFDFRGLQEGTPLELQVYYQEGALLGLSPGIQVIVPLLHYRPAADAQEVTQIRSNLSGHTYNPDLNQFLLIRNNDRRLHVLDRGLSHLQESRVGNSPIGSDIEDIVYLGGPSQNPEYALIAENGRAAIGSIPASTGPGLDLRPWQTIQYAPPPPVGNKGGEGIAYDPATRRMWACNERSPMVVYEFIRPAAGIDASYLNNLSVHQPFDAQTSLSGSIRDISSCLFDPRTQRLLILSHESSKVIDVDWDGTIIASLSVTGARQFEGLTLINQQNLLVSSEPNLIREYRYSGPTP